MTDNSLFTNILDFPTGFSQPFSVSVKDITLGNFTAGQAVDFSDYSNILGNLLVSGSGVSEFSVTGINVDPTNPSVFPIQLQFNTETASFEQRAIPHPQASKSVPEPSSVFGLLLMSATGLFSALHKRQQQQ
ncbi:PEP-CTERM sorting domain-containing protein [[Phormidium] sp. ETS-05]|uniref:PEP-CTERM sorting domain-containing protein n=1 Tax=[Phormidium] sp. ETS-05 TaxID=222819 RepID=UPI0018EF0F77|nr:PEP-CTERM sorting domain-containing protein [[Phormidium] sp. ETS-05]